MESQLTDKVENIKSITDQAIEKKEELVNKIVSLATDPKVIYLLDASGKNLGNPGIAIKFSKGRQIHLVQDTAEKAYLTCGASEVTLEDKTGAENLIDSLLSSYGAVPNSNKAIKAFGEISEYIDKAIEERASKIEKLLK